MFVANGGPHQEPDHGDNNNQHRVVESRATDRFVPVAGAVGMAVTVPIAVVHSVGAVPSYVRAVVVIRARFHVCFVLRAGQQKRFLVCDRKGSLTSTLKDPDRLAWDCCQTRHCPHPLYPIWWPG